MNFFSEYSAYLIAGIASLAISIILMPITIFLLKKINVMDIPNQRKIHTEPIPRMAGIAMYLAFAIPVLIVAPDNIKWQGVIYGGGIALLIGCADDIWGVPALIKLISLFALTLLIWRFGIITNLPIAKMVGVEDVNIHIACNLVLTMLWLTGICSAVNALDHIDGLAGSVSLIAACAYLAVSIQSNQLEWAVVSLALIGSLLGFLCFNTHPAKVFMGDSGSFFLGFSLAAIGIMGGWSTNPIKAVVIPVSVLSIPIFDLCFVIISRVFNGTTNSIIEAIRYCGKDHIGHRLNKMGFSQPLSVGIVCLVSVTISVSALVIRHTLFWESLLLLIQIFMIYIILAIFMEIAMWNTIKVYYVNKKRVKPDK
jgi:UDP-GlcNAc:undecaprenyl-phosphate GlcNAc-1-phosphate transferase